MCLVFIVYAQHIYMYSTSIYMGLDSVYLQPLIGTVLFLPEWMTKHPVVNSSCGACCSDRLQPVTKKDQTSFVNQKQLGNIINKEQEHHLDCCKLLRVLRSCHRTHWYNGACLLFVNPCFCVKGCLLASRKRNCVELKWEGYNQIFPLRAGEGGVRGIAFF